MLLIGAIALALFVLPPGWGIAVVALAAVIEVAEVGFWIRFLRRYRVATGKEALIGSSAEVIEACDPTGRVRFRGEIWHAECPEPVAVGQRVTVTGVRGLTLQVHPSTTRDRVYVNARPEMRPKHGKGPR
jgi:membrane protein implicated in regulation of membrane protease activity